jgi:hypothetical protein
MLLLTPAGDEKKMKQSHESGKILLEKLLANNKSCMDETYNS